MASNSNDISKPLGTKVRVQQERSYTHSNQVRVPVACSWLNAKQKAKSMLCISKYGLNTPLKIERNKEKIKESYGLWSLEIAKMRRKNGKYVSI